MSDRIHQLKSLIGHQKEYTYCCLLYTSDAADERSSVDLGGRRIIKKKHTKKKKQKKKNKSKWYGHTTHAKYDHYMRQRATLAIK